jgi:hypothetical protein
MYLVNKLLHSRLSSMRDEFDLSASAILTAPLSPISLPVLSENETKQQGLTPEREGSER